MEKVKAPIAALKEMIGRTAFVSSELDSDVLKFFGFFIVTNAIEQEKIQHYERLYFDGINTPNLQAKKFHLTAVDIAPGHSLRNVVREPEFLALASRFFQGNVGVTFIRIIRKDKENFKEVSCHHDICYHTGGLEKYSLFIPLTHCHCDNGGLVLYPGTHHYGYLGDAGTIGDILPPEYPAVATDAMPGDILVMHSALWHYSLENKSRTDRVYIQVHLQDINESNAEIELCGARTSEWVLNMREDEIFTSSRTQRLEELYKQLEFLKQGQ
jgi:hypothetical protein